MAHTLVRQSRSDKVPSALIGVSLALRLLGRFAALQHDTSRWITIDEAVLVRPTEYGLERGQVTVFDGLVTTAFHIEPVVLESQHI